MFFKKKSCPTIFIPPYQSGLPPLCLAGKNEGRARDRTRIAGIRNQSDGHYTTQPIFLMDDFLCDLCIT